MFSALFRAADPALGRIDFSLLSAQAKMEIVIDGLTDAEKRQVQDSSGYYFDVCTWDCIQCNGLNEVKRVDLAQLAQEIESPLNLEFIPETVEYFDCSCRNFTGSITTAKLPHSLQTFVVMENAFTGTFDFESLPPNLIILDISMNKLHGPIKLDSLPQALEQIYINSNEFSGTLDFGKLPSSLAKVAFCNTSLEGEVHFGDFAPNLSEVMIGNAPMTGGLDFSVCSDGLHDLDAAGAKLDGELNLHFTNVKTAHIYSLNLASNALSGSITLDHLPRSLEFLMLSSNKLCGALRITELPDQLAEINLSGNNFCGNVRIGKLPNSVESIDLTRNSAIHRISVDDGRSMWLKDGLEVEGQTISINLFVKIYVDEAISDIVDGNDKPIHKMVRHI